MVQYALKNSNIYFFKILLNIFFNMCYIFSKKISSFLINFIVFFLNPKFIREIIKVFTFCDFLTAKTTKLLKISLLRFRANF